MNAGKNMAWLRKIANVSWRIAVLLLPWQVRWFSEGPMVAGLPWEQGRWSIYLSWVPMILFIGCVLAILKNRPAPPPAHSTRHRDSAAAPPPRLGGGYDRRLIWIGLGLLVLASCFTPFPRATGEWWAEVSVLVGFVWALFVFPVSAMELATWVVLSMVPHAILGIQQNATQMVEGSKWLGMAAQNPMTRGVSVVLFEGDRVLRAYGGFPHPNVFGGWLAVAISMTISLAHQTTHRLKGYALVVCAGLFGAALVLSFARTAWLAAFIVIAVSSATIIRPATFKQERPFDLFCLFAVVLVVFAIVVDQAHLILPRVQATNRLERLSIDERSQSLHDGLTLFRRHPFFGVGPGVAIFALEKEGLATIPAHDVPLLALDEVGVVGMSGILFLLIAYGRAAFRNLSRRSVRERWLRLVPVMALVVMLLLDHFPWSLWSGLSLVSLVLLLPFLP